MLCALPLLVAAASLTACSTTVPMEPAPDAAAEACANLTVRLPDSVAEQPRRWTDAQATGAWGSPATVLLTCGVPVIAASELACQTVDGVDWLVDDAEAPRYRLTTFGREPAAEIYVDYDVVSGFDAAMSLSAAIKQLPQVGPTCSDRPES